jgi:hypothetical protein
LHPGDEQKQPACYKTAESGRAHHNG